jgi:ubiquinol-cytochrome c reductase cytochrome b subunit
MRFLKKYNLAGVVYDNAVFYPAPSNFTYMWNFGIYALVCLAVQLVSGIFLAMHYAPEQTLAFFSVEHIMRDVNYGWLLRYIHANGASMFFIVVYVHTFRGLYFGSFSYPREALWIVGVFIILIMILTAFLGYVLPWGQMSFWAATVITNMVSAIPEIGKNIVIWLWGGFSVDNATLNRFFSLHYLLPFVLVVLVLLHLIFLRENSSSNPLGVEHTTDYLYFYPYYWIKDLLGLLVFFIFFAFFVFFMPNYLGHPDNYIMANPMVTPPHIVPEWYFLPFYAILRSIPDKLLGVLAMVFSILILALLPFLHAGSKLRAFSFRPLSKALFYFFIFDCFLLGWIGHCPAEMPYVLIGKVATIFYFVYFIVLVPGAVAFENYMYKLKRVQ